jgi:type III secretion protein U
MAGLLAGLTALAASGPWGAASLIAMVRGAVDRAVSAGRPGSPDPSTWLGVQEGVASLLRTALPICGAAGIAAAAAGWIQVGGLFSPRACAFRLERVDPLRGLRRLCSFGQTLQLGLGLSRAAAVALLVGWELARSAPRLAGLPRLGSVGLLRSGAPWVLSLAVRVALLSLAFGLVDLGLARRRHRRSLRMTREEVERDRKEEEGDPRHRAGRRRLHRALASAGPLARATCLVVNPTHVAVALHHARSSEAAPQVIAKGTGRQARRLRAAARRAGVPVVRQVALARALHRLAEVGDEIPEELYEATAAVLAHLYGNLSPGENG